MSDQVLDIPGLMYHLPQVVSRNMKKHQERGAMAMADLHAKSSFGQVMDEIAKIRYGLCLAYAIFSLFIRVCGTEKPADGAAQKRPSRTRCFSLIQLIH